MDYYQFLQQYKYRCRITQLVQFVRRMIGKDQAKK